MISAIAAAGRGSDRDHRGKLTWSGEPPAQVCLAAGEPVGHVPDEAGLMGQRRRRPVDHAVAELGQVEMPVERCDVLIPLEVELDAVYLEAGSERGPVEVDDPP